MRRKLKYIKTFEDIQSYAVSALYDTGAAGAFGRFKNANPALELEEINEKNITSIIVEMITEYQKEFNETPFDINNGHCDIFAEDVIEKMGGYSDNLYTLSDDMIFNMRDIEMAEENWTGKLIKTKYAIWSENMLNMYGYPPIPLEDINEEGSHVWIYYNGKHYDAECPEGVKNWCSLPIFRKLFESIKKENV